MKAYGENSVGSVIRVNAKQNGAVYPVDTATDRELVIRKGNGVTFTRTLSLVTDGKDGAMQILTQAGDLTPPGRYLGQLVLTYGTNVYKSPEAFTFDVTPDLETL